MKLDLAIFSPSFYLVYLIIYFCFQYPEDISSPSYFFVIPVKNLLFPYYFVIPAQAGI